MLKKINKINNQRHDEKIISEPNLRNWNFENFSNKMFNLSELTKSKFEKFKKLEKTRTVKG